MLVVGDVIHVVNIYYTEGFFVPLKSAPPIRLTQQEILESVTGRPLFSFIFLKKDMDLWVQI